MAASDLTEMLAHWQEGDEHALARLTPLVYHELHRLAERYMRQERGSHTLQATALVNEAYMELVDFKRIPWQSRAHFFGVAANLMRRILVDHARSRNSLKRGGAVQKVPLDCGFDIATAPVDIDIVMLDEAMEKLAQVFPQHSRIVELRYFGGLTIEETATVLGISSGTVKRQWVFAKAWLQRELSAGTPTE